tara:strand:- start:10253 stop:10639 length:387 start_codon:yes stop_codon:yes gene_type:complete
MAFKTADFDSSILPYKIIHDTALSGSNSGTATARVDMTNGESGFLYSMNIDNKVGNPVFLKMTFTESSITVGTTNADLMIKVPASTEVTYTMPEGIDFTKLSMWCVTSGAVAGTTAPANTVLVTLVTS